MGKHSEKQTETPAASSRNPGSLNSIIVILSLIHI